MYNFWDYMKKSMWKFILITKTFHGEPATQYLFCHQPTQSTHRRKPDFYRGMLFQLLVLWYL